MRKVFFLAFVAIVLVSCKKKDDGGNEVNVSPNDYTLSADGLTLVKWTNSSTITIDMQGDSNLRNVNTIANNAFKDLKSLRAITFSDNLKEIGNDAFSGTNLSDGVNFNSYSDVAFGERVFYRSNIRKVVLPNTKELSKQIFADCRNLKEVTFKKTGIIADGAFSSCGTLEIVDLTNAGVTHIGKEAFANCKLLKRAILSVTMNLKTIGDRSFANCTALENVTILALYPPYLEGDPFSGIAKTKLPSFYIPRKPKNLMDIYKGDNNWKNLLDRFQLIPN
ncbi:hypothetical protein RCZ04_09460 [Capnocytophaga sp. HP1101]